MLAGWSGGINMIGKMYCGGVHIVIKSHNNIYFNARLLHSEWSNSALKAS